MEGLPAHVTTAVKTKQHTGKTKQQHKTSPEKSPQSITAAYVRIHFHFHTGEVLETIPEKNPRKINIKKAEKSEKNPNLAEPEGVVGGSREQR